MTEKTDIAERISVTANGDTYEIWLDANRYHYRTDGHVVLMLEGMNHSYPRRVQSAAIKAALKAIVELHGELEAERRKGDLWFGKVADLEAALKAERQRADALQTERDEFRRRLKLERSILQDADKELAALKAKLANPVVLEYRKHDGFTDPEKVRLINAVTDRCAAAIKESGFTVKEGQ